VKPYLKHYRSIFISDSHFGYKVNRSDLLADFLKNHSCDNLYLVGDIFDFWVLKKKFNWTKNDSLALRQMLTKLKNGTKVFFIPGNHDEDIRHIIDDIHIEGVVVKNECEHLGKNGRAYLVIHGDIFDSDSRAFTHLAHIGNWLYIFALHLNKHWNTVRRWTGREPWSVSQYLKGKVKGVVNYVNKFEEHMVEYCKDYDGVICGHIHTPKIDKIGNLEYMNCGDWIESLSALVENTDGSFELVFWKKKYEGYQVSNTQSDGIKGTVSVLGNPS
jgi:UDP-2,3-diacylglucosamine pyrophosphatase LpxH